MDGCSYKAAAGGSLSNTLVALARLGGRVMAGPTLNVVMTGSIGGDPLGGFYRGEQWSIPDLTKPDPRPEPYIIPEPNSDPNSRFGHRSGHSRFLRSKDRRPDPK